MNSRSQRRLDSLLLWTFTLLLGVTTLLMFQAWDAEREYRDTANQMLKTLQGSDHWMRP